MKKFLLLILASVLAVGLVACGNASKKDDAAKSNDKQESAADIPEKLDKPVEIEFWHAMTGGLEETLKEMTDEFNKSQDKITVKLVSQGSYDDLSKKLMASAKAKTSPVMSQAYEDWMTQYVENDLITDLTPYIEDKNHGWTKEELDDIVEVFRDANTWDNKMYGVPFNKSTEVLYYNTDMLKDKGLDVPTNWDEYKKAAAALTTNEGGKKVIGLGLENSIGLSFPTYVRQAGGTTISEDLKSVTFDTPESKDALTFLHDMVTEGTARLAGEDGFMSGPFGRGDVALYVGSSAGIGFVGAEAEGKINWDVAPLPKGKEAATAFQGTNLVMYNSATPEEKLAAWEYMKFLASPEQTVHWAKNTGYVPVRTSALDLPEWKDYVKENPEYGVAASQFDAGYYDPHIKGKSGINEALKKEIQAVLLKQKDVDKGLADLQSTAQSAVDKANK
ncbi:ABC transporter substrate-binding protein [Virgibacillus soli]|uniref:ABC transporter substrate-binding protein n=1 Tax=Paracerasibacillus soli TaxID=480284 RepID=A0ABU5CTB0_9BACI|nr:ABC transporter substrate-binding protein [Virgibacillus soli]MDY0409106.1 ABC transporter substrate-binding protein [Virgibacillus soli]